VTRISVTAEHIALGIPEDPYCCPLSLAIEKSLPGKYPAVGIDCVLNELDGNQIADLPQEATSFIIAFDNGDPVVPFTFELEFKARGAS
jgi:hypothetical protein